MTDERIVQFQKAAEKAVEHLHGEYAKLQTGRANATLVEHITVDAYGQKQELRAVAGVSVQDARTIVIQPWDKSIMGDIESALSQVDLGSSPVNDGVVLRINLPPMTEDRRKELTKIVDQLAEEARISVRQQRQDVHDDIKDNEKDEDVKYMLLEELQKAVDEANSTIEESRKKKGEEVMTV